MQQNFFSLALTKISLFQTSSGSNNLLPSISLITGISIPELLHAERRIQKSGSLDPLKELLSNSLIQRADKFKFKISLKQIHKGNATTREQVASRFLLEISTAKGRFDIDVMMVLKRKFISESMRHHSAQIQVNYIIQQGNETHSYAQMLKIADSLPALRSARRTQAAAAFAA